MPNKLIDLLSRLDRDALQSLLLKLTEHDHRLEQVIAAQITASTPGRVTAPTPVPDVRTVRRAVRSLMPGASGGYGYASVNSISGSVDDVLTDIWPLIQGGDGRSALPLLDVVTEEYLEGYEELDDSDGEGSYLFDTLATAWVEAFLNSELTAQERVKWAATVEEWREKLDNYGLGDGFRAAVQAAEQGWDDPLLQEVLQGTNPTLDVAASSGLYGETTDILTAARLSSLDRQGRLDEYLRLAAATGQTRLYTLMLLRLGRASEAVDYGLHHLATTSDALALAKALRERANGAVDALRMAEHGLTLEGRKAELATWASDLAATLGDTQRAFKAAEIGFRESPDLVTYLKMADLAGQDWPEHRARLLDFLRGRKSYYPTGEVEIFLHEKLIDDAIAAVAGGATHTLVERVADAALTSRPDWVITTSRAQAEGIMDAAKSQYYQSAAAWLARARAAYQATGRQGEWQTYLGGLLTLHSRKRNLVPLLKGLQR